MKKGRVHDAVFLSRAYNRRMQKKDVAELPLLEKCRLLHGEGNWIIHGSKTPNLPDIHVQDGPLGLRIPKEHSIHIYDSSEATCYPSPALLACSWDEELENRIGKALAEECLYNNTDVLLSPGVNIKRNPLCGRNFEYLSEDPLLAGKMAASFIRGIQSEGVGACLKHFACNNQESYRNISDSIVDLRALNEIYLKPFEIAVKEADPWSMMSSYNVINGEYASDNEYLLLKTLKGDWGYQGVVMSDWGGTADYIDSHNHGLDIEMPCFAKKRANQLAKAVKDGFLSKERVDDSAYRVLSYVEKVTKTPKKQGTYDRNKSHLLAVEGAEKSMVLLSNDGILPLKSYDEAIVIGEDARTPRYQGNGSSHVATSRLVSFLDAVGDVPFAQGYRLTGEKDESLIREAAELAKESKTVLLFIALPAIIESESYDRKDMKLPQDQLELFDALYEVNKNIIVVLSCGAPVELPFKDKARAILLSYLGGEGVGEAIDHILLGKVSPSGKLAETWPIRYEDVPSASYYPGFKGQSLYKESIFVGYRYYLTAEKEVAYPFGHGLNYAKFSYELKIAAKSIGFGEKATAEIVVKNLSDIPAETVVELYASAPKGKVFKAKRVLIGFKKVALQGGESKTVQIPIEQNSFAHYDIASSSFKVEGGVYQIEVGESVSDIKAARPLEVRSEDVFDSLEERCPDYYQLPKSGFLDSNPSFFAVLGREVGADKARDQRPFDLNSTFEDIQNTWIGKTAKKFFFKKMEKDDLGEEEKKMMREAFYATPMRSLSTGGVPDRMGQVVLDMANGKPFSALWHLCFEKKRKKS